MSESQLLAYAKQMQTLEIQKMQLEQELSTCNKALDEFRLRKIPELMQSMDIKKITFKGVGRIQLANDVYASTKEGQADRACQWLRDLGYDGMLKETYNMSSVKALFRRMLVAGTEIPDDIFNVTPVTRASIVKG